MVALGHKRNTCQVFLEALTHERNHVQFGESVVLQVTGNCSQGSFERTLKWNSGLKQIVSAQQLTNLGELKVTLHKHCARYLIVNQQLDFFLLNSFCCAPQEFISWTRQTLYSLSSVNVSTIRRVWCLYFIMRPWNGFFVVVSLRRCTPGHPCVLAHRLLKMRFAICAKHSAGLHYVSQISKQTRLVSLATFPFVYYSWNH